MVQFLEIVMKNAYHVIIFAYVSTFWAVFSQKSANLIWRHKLTSRRQIFMKLTEMLPLIILQLLWKFQVIWISFEYFMATYVIWA